jgi:hypothetical protein
MRIFRRHTLAALLGLACIIAGLLLVRRPGTDSAEAKVFERLLQWTAEMPDYGFAESGDSKARKTVINGNTVWMKVAVSTDNIDRILDFYAAQYPAAPMATIPSDRLTALAKAPGAEDVAESARMLTEFLECLNGHFRIERSNWGVWGALIPHDEGLRFGDPAYSRAYLKAVESGKLGDMGTARVVVAMKPRHSERARIVSFWTTRDLDLDGFQPEPGKDLGGRDIDAVPRFPNTVRLLSFEQHNARSVDTIAVYAGGGSEVQTVLFFNSRMPAAGWRRDGRLTAQATAARAPLTDAGRTLFFTRNNRECVIQIHRSQHSSRLLTTIIDRTTPAR